MSDPDLFSALDRLIAQMDKYRKLRTCPCDGHPCRECDAWDKVEAALAVVRAPQSLPTCERCGRPVEGQWFVYHATCDYFQHGADPRAGVRAPQREDKPDERTIRGLVGTLQTVLPRELYLQVARYFSEKPFDPGAAVENVARSSKSDVPAARLSKIQPVGPREEA